MSPEKEKKIVELVAAGVPQGDVAARFNITQQMVSKIWLAATHAPKGRRGGKRRGHQYAQLLERRAGRINNQRKGS